MKAKVKVLWNGLQKMRFIFCFSPALHYLCNNFEKHKLNLFMKLSKLLGAMLSVAIAFPAQVHAQETVKTSPGYAKTKTFVHHHDARKVSKHLTPIRGGKAANPLLRPGISAPHYMLPSRPQQRQLYKTPAGTTICGSLIYCRSWEQLPDFLPRPYGIYSFTAADGAVTSQDIASTVL